MRETPEWHKIAKKLRAEGATIREISAAIGKTYTMVHWCLDEKGQRNRKRERNRSQRAGGPKGNCLVERRQTQYPRACIGKSEAQQRNWSAAQAFIAGHVDREGMSRMMRGDA